MCWLHSGLVITSSINCGVKLLIHSQTCYPGFLSLELWQLKQMMFSRVGRESLECPSQGIYPKWSAFSVGNSHRSAIPRPTTLEEDRERFADFSSILCLWFEIQAMRTYNFFDWVSNTECIQPKHLQKSCWISWWYFPCIDNNNHQYQKICVRLYQR